MTDPAFSPILGELLRTHGTIALLESARLAGCIAVSPLPWTYAPLRVRVGVLLTLVVVVHGQSPPATGFDAGSALLGAASEAVVGAAMGFVVRLIFAVAEIAAGAISPTMGIGAAQILMPGNGQTGVLEQLLLLLSVWLGVVVGIHRALIAALVASFRILPVGSVIDPTGGARVLLALSAAAFETGVRLALPILAVLFVVQLGLAFVSRAAPAMQIFSVGFAVTLITGGAVLLAILPDFGHMMAVEISHAGSRIEELLTAFAG